VFYSRALHTFITRWHTCTALAHTCVRQLSFHKLTNLNNVTTETIKPAGRVPTASQQYVVAYDETNNHLFTAGCGNEVIVWEVTKVQQKGTDDNDSKFKYVATQTFLLQDHEDTVQDCLVVDDKDYELAVLVTASLDTNIKVRTRTVTNAVLHSVFFLRTLCYVLC